MRHVVLMLLLGSRAALASAAPPTKPPAAAVAGQVQAVLARLRAEQAFPGATAAWVLPDGTLGTAAIGWADREAGVPMTPDARMLSGSTGKSFAAALVLSLVLEGRLELDAPIARWLGHRPWFRRLPNAPELTLRRLLRHQSGLIDHVHSPRFRDAIRARLTEQGPDAAFAPESLVRFVLDTEPLFPAGQGYHYSDTNYVLAGLVVQAVTGRSYYRLLASRLLEPLGLEHTGPADGRRLPGLVAGYVRDELPLPVPAQATGRGLKVAEDGVLTYNPATEWTGGGLVTNAADLARWAHLLYRGRALPGEYLDELLDAVRKDESQRARYGEEVAYGLGVTIRRSTLGVAYGHRGWTPGYLSVFEYYPEQRIAVAVQVNELGPHDMAAMAQTLAQAVRAGLDRVSEDPP
jgi:D-alanyl-D-alanine carboxypeptidase